MDSQSSVGGASDVGTPRMDTEPGSYSNEIPSSTGPVVPDHTSENTSELTARARPIMVPKMDEIPVVTDETGERVRESFQSFLERYFGCISN